MSKYQNAIDSISRLSLMFKGLSDLSEGLSELDSLENHLSELNVKKVSLLSEVEALELDRENFKDEKKKLKEDVKKALDEAKVKAEAIHNEGILKGDAYVKAAEILVAESKVEIANMKETFNLEWSEANQKLASLRSEIISEQARLDLIKAEIEKIKGL